MSKRSVDANGFSTETVEQYITHWLNTYKLNSIKQQSFDRLESTNRIYIITEFGSKQMNSLHSDDIQNYLNQLSEKGKSYSMIKKIYDAMNECYRHGVEKGDFLRNPMNTVVLKEYSKNSRKKKIDQILYYSQEETALLIATATSAYGSGTPRFRLGWAIPLILNTGMRVGELAALQWDKHVNFEENTILIEATQVTIKNRDSSAEKKYLLVDQEETKSVVGIRKLKMNDAAREAMENLKNVTGTGKYVVSTKSGEPISITHLDRMMNKVCKAAGFTEDRTFGMHALRHTFASWLFFRGVDVKTVSALLGHSSTKTTADIYIHLIEDRTKKALHVPDDL